MSRPVKPTRPRPAPGAGPSAESRRASATRSRPLIARLTGRIIEKQPHQVVIDTGGVGYLAFVPLSTFYTLPDEGAEVTLRIHTHVREDQIALYGFSSSDEQE